MVLVGGACGVSPGRTVWCVVPLGYFCRFAKVWSELTMCGFPMCVLTRMDLKSRVVFMQRGVGVSGGYRLFVSSFWGHGV